MLGERIRSAVAGVTAHPSIIVLWEDLYRLTGGTFRVHCFVTRSHVPGTTNPKPLNYAVMWRALLHPRRLFLVNKEPPDVALLQVEAATVRFHRLPIDDPQDLIPVGGGDVTDGLNTNESQTLLLSLLIEAKETIRLAALRALGKGAVV